MSNVLPPFFSVHSIHIVLSFKNKTVFGDQQLIVALRYIKAEQASHFYDIFMSLTIETCVRGQIMEYTGRCVTCLLYTSDAADE